MPALPLNRASSMCMPAGACTVPPVSTTPERSCLLCLLRPLRRYVVAGEALVPYDWYDAMGRWLLSELDRSAAEGATGPPPAPEGGVLCVPAAARGHYLVATSRKVCIIGWGFCSSFLGLPCRATTWSPPRSRCVVMVVGGWLGGLEGEEGSNVV